METWAECSMVVVIAICITVYYIAKLKHTNVAGELEKLAELKAKGLLSEEEFARQKRKILGS